MIRIIVALDQKRGIAKHGGQPWYIPSDEQYFKEMTSSKGGVVLMGQKTLEAIGHPLENRANFVLSREARQAEGLTYIQDIDKFFGEQTGDVWVIGGASVFSQAINVADELYITHIQADFGCDQQFPEYEHVFEERSSSELHTQNGFIYTFHIYGKL